MPAFSSFDTRGYRTVSAREGYGLWSPSYEETVKEDMDLWLLDQVRTVDWAATRRAADLGCGTGRTGSWLAAHGVRRIDGIDLTPEMLERARRRGVFETLAVADVCASGLEGHTYDLVTTSLVDEHLRDLRPLYLESARIAGVTAAHVVVGFHPFFIMKVGMPTHFEGPDGQPIAIETYVHLFSDHAQAALAAGWSLAEMHEQVIDERWIETKPAWDVHRDVPISFLAGVAPELDRKSVSGRRDRAAVRWQLALDRQRLLRDSRASQDHAQGHRRQGALTAVRFRDIEHLRLEGPAT